MGRRSRKRSSAAAPVRAGGRERENQAGERTDPHAVAQEAAASPTDVRDGKAPASAPRRAPGTTSRRARLDEAPQPPWAPFPLTEICIFVGLVVLAFALLTGAARAPLIAFGLGVLTIATLELALREHLGGYRSHSALLAGLSAVLVAAPLAMLVRPPKGIVLIAAAAAFLLALQLFREVFRRRSGGMSWRA